LERRNPVTASIYYFNHQAVWFDPQIKNRIGFSPIR
jgi:hypothetical protein